MKRITLLRHAKSSWKDMSLDDFDRPLNKRGREDAPVMGKRLSRHGHIPDLVISSPAKRAITTAEVVAGKLGYPLKKLVEDAAVYEADVPSLVKLVQRQEEGVEHLMLVGHNPGFTDLANHLLGEEHIDNIPTCGVIFIELDIASWRDAGKATGKLVLFDYPKNKQP